MDISMTIDGVQYFLIDDRLKIVQMGDMVFDVSLSPILNSKLIKITRWEKIAKNHFEASLGEYGKAIISERFDKLSFWIETPIKQFENVTYLSDGIISGQYWRTFVSDEYEKIWDKKVDTNIPLSSAYAATTSPDGKSDGGITDPDDIPVHWIWNVHVRAFAFKGIERWLGVSIPGPWGIGITRLNMHKSRFNLRFEVLQTGCTEGKMPVVYFCPNLADDLSILDEHRDISEKLGLMDLKPKNPPDWHLNPWYGYYDEMQRQLYEKLITTESSNVMDLLDQWVRKVRESCQHKKFNINLEQGCYRLYGDYRPAKVMGNEKHVREVIDNWRREGIHAGHYIHPFIVNTKVEFFKKHPEAFCKPKNPDFLMDYPLETWDRDNPKFAPIDWTHPLGREYMLNWVEYLLSSADGCMNYDILRSNHWRSPDPREYEFYDPDWGIGDMMTYKVQKLIYERAKAVKPDCMVTKVAALDCYMQPTYDAMQVSEDWTPTMEHWYRRSQLASILLKNTLFWIDAWFCTRTKWNEYFMSMMACTIPETVAVDYATHPYYPSWRKLQEKHHRRRKAGIHLYLNSLPSPSDDSRVIWKNGQLQKIYRLKTNGPLTGWYGALTLSPKCVVSYNEHQAMVVSSENRFDWVPLPPNAKLLSIKRVFHNGKVEDYEHLYDKNQHRVKLYIEDSGGKVFCYRIKYNLISDKE